MKYHSKKPRASLAPTGWVPKLFEVECILGQSWLGTVFPGPRPAKCQGQVKLFCISYFCLFSILFADARSGSPSPSERLTSNSRVASDHQNLHRLHRHNIGLKLCFETGFVPGSTCDRGKSKMEKKTNTQIQRQIHCTVHCAAGWPGSGYSQTVVKLKQSSLRFQINGSDAALVELSGY